MHMQVPSGRPDPRAEQAYWDRQAKRYDRAVRWLGGATPLMVVRVAQAAQGLPRVLEVAAGTGLVTAALARSAHSVVATDSSPGMVAALKQRVAKLALGNVTVAQADLCELPSVQGEFDAVVAANVLHLMPDLSAALASLAAALRPGGLLIAPTYAHDQTWTGRCVSVVLLRLGLPARQRFTAERLSAAIAAAGFEVVHCVVLPGRLPIAYVEARKRPEPGQPAIRGA